MGAYILRRTLGAIPLLLGTATLIYAMSWKGGISPNRMILVGIGLQSMLGAVETFLVRRFPIEDVIWADNLLLGSVVNASWGDVRLLAVGLAVLIPAALFMTSYAHAADIVDTAVSAGKFNTLVAAVKAAGLAETLKGGGPFTVFAPTDAAFDKLPPGTVQNLLKPENREQLRKVLAYHVVSKGDYRFAASFVMQNEPGPVAIAYSESIRPRLHFSTCWGCPGETGKILFRAPERAVIFQP